MELLLTIFAWVLGVAGVASGIGGVIYTEVALRREAAREARESGDPD